MYTINLHRAKARLITPLMHIIRDVHINLEPITRLRSDINEAETIKIVGGGLRLQEKEGRTLTPDYLDHIASHKYE